ncbi:hypothetical protein Y1Q_0022154 [Alligator mississippiensis]|uniref:Uncharacterized protein n=1 Tax=Alligator mississippiensis TaxID=8496 RepID=A0A151NZU0_ALLMI|nr:hypothetical protein Y1Q_0022154 [Alligator mississippiensis]
MVAEERLVDLWAWRMKDIICKQERDRERDLSGADQEFRDRFLALEKMHLGAQEWHVALVARAVETTEEDCWVLNTVLTLVVASVPPTALP